MNPLMNVPGLAGYLAQNQMNQQAALGNLQQVRGMQDLLTQQAQQARVQRNDQREDALAQAVAPFMASGDLAGAARAAASTPGGLQTGMQFLTADEGRKARMQQASMALEARRQQLEADAAAKLERARERGATQLEIAQLQAESRKSIAEMLNQTRMALAEAARANRPPPRIQTIQTADGIMRVNPDGTTEPMLGKDGKPLRSPSITSGSRQDANIAIQEYNRFMSDQQVKMLKWLQPNIKTSVDYFQQVQADPSKQSNAQDKAVAKLFMAMTTMKSDRVTDLDLRDFAKQPGLDERISNAIVKVLDGDQLPPKTRADLMNFITQKYQNTNSQVIQLENLKRQQLERLGFDPSLAVPRIADRKVIRRGTYPDGRRIVEYEGGLIEVEDGKN